MGEFVVDCSQLGWRDWKERPIVALGSHRAHSCASNELTSAFGQTVLDRDRYTAYFNGWMCSNDFVDPMRFAIRVMPRAINRITKSSNRYAVDGVNGRATDDFSSVVCRVAYYNDL